MPIPILLRQTSALALVFCSLGLLFSAPVQASSLQDLKSALSRQSGQTVLKAVLEAKTWRRLGDGQEAEDINGFAEALLEDRGQGLQINFAKDLLNKIDQEEKLRAKAPNSKTPTLAALRQFEASEMRSMTAAAPTLARMLERASFRQERRENYQGKPTRVLSFDIPLETLSERERKYVKKFEGNLDIWIAADGTPLASRLNYAARGRVFLVIGFELKFDEHSVYALLGERLVVKHKESSSSASGAGERSEEKVTKIMQLQS